MSSTFKNLMLLLLAVLALIGGYWLSQNMRSEPKPLAPLTYGGGAMINFTLPDLDGKRHALDQWRGKVIVLNFWATWCEPCREEIPLLVDLQKRFGANGLQVIGVAVDNKTAIMLYRQSVNMNYPILLGENEALPLLAQYGNTTGSIPFTVIIEHNGNIAVRKLGAFNKTELESLVLPLVGQKSG